MTYAEGYKKWEKRVSDKGRAEGSLETQKENLLDALQDSFNETPQPVLEFLAKATDMAALRRLTRAAWRAASLEDFLALLDKERLAQAG